MSRSYSYPLETPSPWNPPTDPMDSSRKGSMDSNPPRPLEPPTLQVTPSTDPAHAIAVVEDPAKTKKMWRASGSVVQQKVTAWKPGEPLNLSHLNFETIPKALFKSDQYHALKELDVSYNKLSSIPPQISQLKLLVLLDCTFNRLTDLPVELGELSSLDVLHLSGNPLNKELMQRHLLGTASVLQYLKERQATEQVKYRRSNKFKGLRSTSDPDSKSREEPHGAPTLLSPPLLSPLAVSSPSDVPTPNPSPRSLLSASDNAIKKAPPPLTRQRSGPSPTPAPPSPNPTPSLTHPPPSPSTQALQSPASPITPAEPQGDMGPIITQLKFGIIYTETIKALTATSPDTAKQRSVSQGSHEDYIHNQNGTGVLITSNTHGTKEKFVLRDGEGRFTFNTYCTAAFAELRTLSNVPQDRYLAALESISALGFAGKSGSVLLKSSDGLLVLKTISKDEAAFLRKIMPTFLAYIKNNPKTYLTRFWGLYKVIHSPLEKINFVVMKNAFFTTKKIHERYDLKGSTVGRTTNEENVRRSRIVLKDLNFNRQLKLGPDRGKAFMAQIAKDTEFLQKFDIIDYSLIVGVHYLFEPPTKDPSKDYPLEGEIQAMDKDSQLLEEIYFLAIIDMLQPYNIRKQMEYGIKSLRYGTGISVIPPENYAARFVSFIQSVVE